VELVELSLEIELAEVELVLEVELSVEVVEAELVESALCSASRRVCRSLDSLEEALDDGGGGGGPPAGGGPLGGPPAGAASSESLDELTALTEDTEVAVEVELWLDAASNSRSSCQADEPLDELTELMDMRRRLSRSPPQACMQTCYD
jgi:hypothetical protein